MSPEVATLARIQEIAPTARVYMLKLPQQPTLPAAVILLVDDTKAYHLRGGSFSGRARVQIDVYAAEASGIDPYTEAADLADTIHGDEAGSGLSAFQGLAGGSPDGLFLTGVFREDRQASYEADERRTVRIRQDYFVYYRNG